MADPHTLGPTQLAVAVGTAVTLPLRATEDDIQVIVISDPALITGFEFTVTLTVFVSVHPKLSPVTV